MRHWVSFLILVPLLVLGCSPHQEGSEPSPLHRSVGIANEAQETNSISQTNLEGYSGNSTAQLLSSFEEQIEDIVTRRYPYAGTMEAQLANLGPDAIPGIVSLLYDPEFKWPGVVLNSLNILSHPDAATPLLNYIEDIEGSRLDFFISIPQVLHTISTTANPIATPKLLELILANDTDMETKNAAALALLAVNADEYGDFANRFILDAFLYRGLTERFQDTYMHNELIVSISALPSQEALSLTKYFLMQDLASGMTVRMIDNIARNGSDKALSLLLEFSLIDRPQTEDAYQVYAIDRIVERVDFEEFIEPETLIKRLNDFNPGLHDMRLHRQNRTVVEMISHLEFEY